MINMINDACEDPQSHWRDCVTASVSFQENARGISLADGENVNLSRNLTRLNLFLGPKMFPNQKMTFSYDVHEGFVYAKRHV